MVPMRDGVSLAIDVYLPEAAAACAAVLVRLPYDKNGRYCWMPFIARHFTDRGYAFLVQDVRGKFRSGGEMNAFVHELDDGYDTIEWITRPALVERRVGMWGDSYYGFTQWTAVASGHPALRRSCPASRSPTSSSGWTASTPLYGAHYLAQYWTDGHSLPLDAGLDAAASVRALRRRLRGDRLAIDRVRPPACGGARRRRASSCTPPATRSTGCASRRCTALAGSTTSPRRTCSTTSGSCAIPPRRRTSTSTPARPTTRTTGSRTSRSPTRTTTRSTTTRSTACSPRYLEPALDFFDAFLAVAPTPASVPRVRWHLGNDGWRESPTLAAARRAGGAPAPPAGGGARARAGRRGRGGLGARSGRPRPLDHRRSRSRSCSSTRTRARSRPGRTWWSSPASPSPRRSRSRAASSPTCGSEATARRCAST